MAGQVAPDDHEEAPVTPYDPILLNLPETLEGARVHVRPYRPGDGATFYAAINTHRQPLSRWLAWIEQYSNVDQAEAYARRQAARWLLREQFVASLWLKATGDYLGGSGFHHIDWSHRRAELGYFILPVYEGHGLATEAVSLLVDFAFQHLRMRRVEAQCDAENERNFKLLRRLGFDLEGHKRQDFVDHHGQLRDTLLFARLDSR